MKATRTTLAALCILLAAVAALGFWIGRQTGARPVPAAATTAPAPGPAQPDVLYWYDPMVPGQHFDRPGKSPFMDMPLVPRVAEAGAGHAASDLAIDPAIAQRLGMRLARVQKAVLDAPVSAVASIQFDDRDVAWVQARASGFVQRVYARAPGDFIAQGAPLADLLVPEWAGAQEEFLAVLRSGDATLADAARRRLQLLGVPAGLVERVAASGRTEPTITIAAPIAGVIVELGVRAGMSLAQGATVARINGIGTVWLEAAVPQAQAAAIRVGQAASATVTAWPGSALAGKVIAVLPQVDATNRALRVRIALPNPGGRLKPGMFAQVRLAAGPSAPVLVVPTEAVIRTGMRDLVIVSTGGGHFRPVQVTIGGDGGERTAVLAGLAEGEEVVASGQFLLDSEASLRGIVSPDAAAEGSAGMIRASGRVERVEPDRITISHGPIAALGWGAMTRPYELASPSLAADLKAGDQVRFELVRRDGRWIIASLRRIGGAS
jgi:membrane fusion protein, copper/silver efflux system